MRRRDVRLWPVLAIMSCLFAVFLVASSQVNVGIRETEEKLSQQRVILTKAQTENSELTDLLEAVGTDSFIENQARTMFGYMKQDELRLVITNPEVLYGTDQVPVR